MCRWLRPKRPYRGSTVWLPLQSSKHCLTVLSFMSVSLIVLSDATLWHHAAPCLEGHFSSHLHKALPCLSSKFTPIAVCKLHTPSTETKPRNYLSAEQRSMSHPLHLVHFSFSINKCFHFHTAAAAAAACFSPFSLSHIHTHTQGGHMNHGGWCATKLCRSLWKHSTQCIFHEALDAVLFMPVSSAVLFGRQRAEQ